MLDLGCGTGLAGVELKPHSSRLEGIDISEKMLKEARAKNVYDKLTKGDILEYRTTTSLDFNYFIATDVFVYLGDLSEIFKLIKSRNRSAGRLVFSTEDTDEEGFSLEKSGRYSHSRSYIKSLCEEFNYQLCHFETKDLRKEGNDSITGGLYLLNF